MVTGVKEAALVEGKRGYEGNGQGRVALGGSVVSKLTGWADWRTLLRFLVYFLKRFMRDDCPRIAASLSYSTLLSLVPLLAIALAILSVMPLAEGLYDKVQHAVLENVIPDVGSEIEGQITDFVSKANQASGIGFAVLFVTGFLLLTTIISAFNTIWRVTEQRSLIWRLFLKWIMLISWPFLVGISISLSSYAFAMVQWVGIDDIGGTFVMARSLSFGIAVLAFGSLYIILPGRPIRFLDALVGAVVAALLFDLLKSGFGIYLQNFPTYQAIYGVLAAVPIFLVWMYLTWTVVLLGAEITAALPEWRAGARATDQEIGPAEKVGLALTLLGRLQPTSRGSGSISEAALTKGLPAPPGHVSEVLRRLRRNGFVRRQGSRWQLARDLVRVDLNELLAILNLHWEANSDWSETVQKTMDQLLRDPVMAGRTKLSDLMKAEGEDKKFSRKN